MQAAGLRISEIARHLGVNRRRLDKWAQLDTLPERRCIPRPGTAESFRDYLRQRCALLTLTYIQTNRTLSEILG
jgi:hypothetical protein